MSKEKYFQKLRSVVYSLTFLFMLIVRWVCKIGNSFQFVDYYTVYIFTLIGPLFISIIIYGIENLYKRSMVVLRYQSIKNHNQVFVRDMIKEIVTFTCFQTLLLEIITFTGMSMKIFIYDMTLLFITCTYNLFLLSVSLGLYKLTHKIYVSLGCMIIASIFIRTAVLFSQFGIQYFNFYIEYMTYQHHFIGMINLAFLSIVILGYVLDCFYSLVYYSHWIVRYLILVMTILLCQSIYMMYCEHYFGFPQSIGQGHEMIQIIFFDISFLMMIEIAFSYLKKYYKSHFLMLMIRLNNKTKWLMQTYFKQFFIYILCFSIRIMIPVIVYQKWNVKINDLVGLFIMTYLFLQITNFLYFYTGKESSYNITILLFVSVTITRFYQIFIHHYIIMIIFIFMLMILTNFIFKEKDYI